MELRREARCQRRSGEDSVLEAWKGGPAHERPAHGVSSDQRARWPKDACTRATRRLVDGRDHPRHGPCHGVGRHAEGEHGERAPEAARAGWAGIRAIVVARLALRAAHVSRFGARIGARIVHGLVCVGIRTLRGASTGAWGFSCPRGRERCRSAEPARSKAHAHCEQQQGRDAQCTGDGSNLGHLLRNGLSYPKAPGKAARLLIELEDSDPGSWRASPPGPLTPHFTCRTLCGQWCSGSSSS